MTPDGAERGRGTDEAQYLDIVITPLRDNGDRSLGTAIAFKDATD